MNVKHPLFPFVKNEKVVEYIDNLVKAIPNLKVKIEPPRHTKLGYMKDDKSKHIYIISLNNNLSPSKFLYVFLHEYAHLLVVKQYKHKNKPHGIEWQQTFFNLLNQAIENQLFHPQITDTIIKQFLKPFIYSKKRDALIIEAINKIDHPTPIIYVKDLNPGSIFQLSNGFQFKMIEKRRTRYICENLQSHKKYLVSSFATVNKIILKM
ncbi:MAG: SprT-like domain-containing protein [Bacteroidales bacterium]|nr:SprT-like domain-containing protein [Bacteroidales bacterium]